MRNSRINVVAAIVVASFAQAASAAANGHQIIDLKAPDGVVLKASYYSAGKPGPAILMLHACNKDRNSWTPLATAAAARGFHVLALDFRGFGESGGPRFAPGPEQQQTTERTWPGDVDAAFTWLTSQAGVDKTRVAAIGASCGVNQSVQLARRHPEVKTIVMLSGNTNQEGRFFLRDTPIPLLAAASWGDGGAVNQARWLLGWSRNPANKFVEYKAAGHGTEMFSAEKGLEPIVLNWFKTHLKDAPAKPAAVAASAPTAAEKFWTTLTAPGGVAKARQMYDDARKAGKKDVLFPETEMNLFGYQLLQQDNNPKDAVEVFKMNVEAYPSSANTYDSLSDGYLALGNRDDALRYAEKALALLAKDTEAPENFKTLVKESADKKVQELKKK